MLSIIVAFGENREIGKDGWMPWDLKEDLKLFKERTINHNLIMGSTTFLGLPKPLKDRHTYVITRRSDLPSYDNVTYINDFDSFINQAKLSSDEYFVCGGAKIYTQCLEYCDKMYISHVEGEFDADTFFPEIDYRQFDVVSSKEYDKFILKEYKRK